MRLEVSELGVGQRGREVRWMEEWAGPDPTGLQGPQEGVEPSLQWEAGLWHGEVCLFERSLWLLSERQAIPVGRSLRWPSHLDQSAVDTGQMPLETAELGASPGLPSWAHHFGPGFCPLPGYGQSSSVSEWEDGRKTDTVGGQGWGELGSMNVLFLMCSGSDGAAGTGEWSVASGQWVRV